MNIYIYMYVLYILAVPHCEFKMATGLSVTHCLLKEYVRLFL